MERANPKSVSLRESFVADCLCGQCSKYHGCPGYIESRRGELACLNYIFSRKIQKEIWKIKFEYWLPCKGFREL